MLTAGSGRSHRGDPRRLRACARSRTTRADGHRPLTGALAIPPRTVRVARRKPRVSPRHRPLQLRGCTLNSRLATMRARPPAEILAWSSSLLEPGLCDAVATFGTDMRWASGSSPWVWRGSSSSTASLAVAGSNVIIGNPPYVVWALCFANRPSQLFDGAQKRLTILLGCRSAANDSLHNSVSPLEARRV